MIAIFSKAKDFDGLRCMPANNFRRIKDSNSIMGVRFTGIICVNGFYEDKNISEAYEKLYQRQPELFTLKLR